MGGVKVVWWGGWPWRWRFYLVRRSQWGPFGELLVGPVGFTWPAREAEAERDAAVQERDFLLSDPDNVSIKEWHDRLKGERDAAEQRATDMEKALRQIVDVPTNALGWGLDCKDIARAVLSAREDTQ